MGFPTCDICDEPLGFPPGELHVCQQSKIISRINELEEKARVAETRLEDVRSAVFRVLENVPSLEGERVTVNTEFLRKLWDSANCRWYEAKTPEDFLSRWMAMHWLLIQAFEVFYSKKRDKRETLLEKLAGLREACDRARSVMGYKDSKFDMTPEDLVK